MIMVSKKSQSWSIDISVAVVVFLLAFFVVYALLNTGRGSNVSDLSDQASSIISQVASEDSLLRIVDDSQINESRLHILKNISYEDLKRQFRIEGDFCIFIEDTTGNIILINNTYRGIGAPTINLSGIPCSQR